MISQRTILSDKLSHRHLGVHATLAAILLQLSCAPALRTPSSLEPRSSTAVGPSRGPIRTVVIDAGHGGHDPGTSHYGLKEKHLVLDMARRLRTEFQNVGLKVIMTRDSDKFIPLSSRPAIATRNQADLFISVHVNANKSRAVHGAEVYFPRESTMVGSTRWPPFVSPTEVSTTSAAAKRALWDMVLRRTRVQSQKLAQSVCGELCQTLTVACKVKSARFVVLREATMPAVLVEVGYVSNKAESERLNSPEYRGAAARAIAEGVMSYVRAHGGSI